MGGLYGQYDTWNQLKKDKRGGAFAGVRFGLKMSKRWEREQIQGGSKINGFFFFNGVRVEIQRDMYQENGFFMPLYPQELSRTFTLRQD